MSEVKINGTTVNKEWVEFPVGARLDLLANVNEVSTDSSRSYQIVETHGCFGLALVLVVRRDFTRPLFTRRGCGLKSLLLP